MIKPETGEFVFEVRITTPDDTDNPNFLVDQAHNLAEELRQWEGVEEVDWSRVK